MAEHLFYDGHCGLCHTAVRFVLARDEDGTAFRFAPLGGNTFEHAVPARIKPELPDSMVVKTDDGRILTRSAAVLHIGRRLGGAWRVLARLGSIVPSRLADLVYDGVARIRFRVFGRPEQTCPLLPPDLRRRFDD